MTNIKYASDRSSGIWPVRMMRGVRNSVKSWTDGLFNFFRRRSFTPSLPALPTLPSFSLPFTSNKLATLYRPEAWELDDPYTRKRKDRYHQQVVNLFNGNRRNYNRMSNVELTASRSEANTVEKQRIQSKRRNIKKRPYSDLTVAVSGTEIKPRIVKPKSNYDHSAWKPVTRPNVETNLVEEEEEEVISERNFWKKIPQFSTSSNNTMDTFHWRSYPILSNRRSDGKKGNVRGTKA